MFVHRLFICFKGLFKIVVFCQYSHKLKPHNQTKIVKKTSFLFWPVNMSIICEHVHRLELRSLLNFRWLYMTT